MARVEVSTTSEVSPEAAWKLASDLRRFDEWMTIFSGWRSDVPSTIEEGTCVSSLIKVKGFRNTIHWTVTHYDEPKFVELKGRGRGGIRTGRIGRPVRAAMSIAALAAPWAHAAARVTPLRWPRKLSRHGARACLTGLGLRNVVSQLTVRSALCPRPRRVRCP